MLDRVARVPDERADDSVQVARRLWGYIAPEWRLLSGVLVTLLINGVSQGGAPALIGIAVDRYISRGDPSGLAQTMGLLLGVYLLGLVAFVGQAWLMGIVSQRVLVRIRLQIFSHIQTLSLSYFDRHEAGDLMSRLVNDTNVIGTTLSQGLVQSLGALFGLVGIIIGMLLLSWRLAIAALVMLPVMFVTTQLFSRRARAAYRVTRETIGDVSSSIQEDISSVREAQAFNRTGENIERFEASNAANRDANVRAGGVTSAFGPAIDVLSTVATAIVAGVGGWLAFSGTVTVGVVVAFLAYVDRFFRPVQQISSLYTQLQAAFAASERIFELLDSDPEIVDRAGATILPRIEGAVRFDNVSFRYGEGPWVLHDLSFEVAAGETIAIVGPTGAGKSTLANLIGRFYDVTSGRVTVDGHDVRDVTRASLRGQLGIVPQESFLFASTIADNIRYGRPEASLAQVRAAAETARAAPFIEALPDGYETKLGERGGSLSQGQRQLIGIARALLADPRLLILDEATASVDTRTERLIQAALEILLHDRTAFVIAHRLATVRNADRILVLRDGRILESGRHEELLAVGGLYADLYERQIRPAA